MPRTIAAILAIVFCLQTLPNVQADIVEFHAIRNTLTLFDWGSPDDGTLDGASETWTETITAGSGDYSYDVELTISTNSGALVEGTGGDLDVANEELHTFTLSVSDFMDLSGTGNFSLDSFTFSTVVLDAANTSDDSGEFVANGITATWIDYNTSQTGENFEGEPLNLLGTPFDGSDVTSFTHAHTGGDYRFDRLDFQVTIAQVPEPGTAGIFAIALAGLFFRRKN